MTPEIIKISIRDNGKRKWPTDIQGIEEADLSLQEKNFIDLDLSLTKTLINLVGPYNILGI